MAVGIAITLTFLARSAVTAAVPLDPAAVTENRFYPVGFVLVVMGRYHLFTVNTLTPVTLALTRVDSLRAPPRIRGIVVVANVLGGGVGALPLATTDVVTPRPPQSHVASANTPSRSRWDLFFEAVFAGDLVAAMVWLVHASRDTATRVSSFCASVSDPLD